MNFYYLSIDPEKTKTIPQEKGIRGHYDFRLARSVRNSKYWGLLDETVFPEGIILNYRAQFTDLADLNLIGRPWLVISQSFYNLLQNFNLPYGKWGQTLFIKKSKELPYYIYTPYQRNYHCIDFGESEILLYNRKELSREKTNINSTSEYLQKQSSLIDNFILECRKPVFNFSNESFDLFLTPNLFGPLKYIISEKLKTAIEAHELKWMQFKLIENLT